MYLVPNSATRNIAGGVDELTESSGDGRPITENKCDVVNTDTSRKGPGRGEIVNVIVLERGVIADELGDGGSLREASGRAVQNIANEESADEAPSHSGNASYEALGG